MNNRNTTRILAAIAVVTLTISTSFARIGETEQECAARYGQPIKKLQDDKLLCQKSGLGIFITFFNGKADAIAYRKIAGNVLRKGEKIPDNEVELLLKSNTGDNPWKEACRDLNG